MGLDVHHVADAKQRVVVESRTRIGPIEGFRARAAGRPQVLFEVEAFAEISASLLKVRCVHTIRYEWWDEADLAAN